MRECGSAVFGAAFKAGAADSHVLPGAKDAQTVSLRRECIPSDKKGSFCPAKAMVIKMKLNYGTEVIALPAEALRKNAGLGELRVLLLLASEQRFREASGEHAEEAAERCGLSRAAFDAAVAFWVREGILSEEDTGAAAQEHAQTASGKKKALLRDEKPQYGGEQLAALLEDEGKDLKGLIDSCQNLLGKVLNPTEVSKLVALSDYLRLDHAYILLMVQYCMRSGKRSVAYIEAKTYGMYNDGIDTYEKLDVYIKNKEKYDPVIRKLRTMLGMQDRAPSKKENACFRSWLQEMELPVPLIEHAYEVTVNKTGKASLPYMNKLLTDWYAKGIRTAEDAEKETAAFREKKAEDAGSFKTDEFIDAALRRSYADMNLPVPGEAAEGELPEASGKNSGQ